MVIEMLLKKFSIEIIKIFILLKKEKEKNKLI